MKLLRLDLTAFGPFTGKSLDFTTKADGLQIIYGPNEAGKSSTLRAVRQLLFGFPTRYGAEEAADNFLHDYKALRIGAALSDGNGTILEVVRRKGNTKTLRGADDEAVVDPAMLDRLLSDMDRKNFETMFAIDHAMLVAGGQEILDQNGQFAEVLFAASAGLASLRATQESLTKQMRELFLPTGSIPKINRLIQEYTQAKKRIKELQLGQEEWLKHESALREAEEKKREIDKRLRELKRELARLDRIRKALKPLAARKQFLDELSELKDVPLLRDGFGKIRQEAQQATALAENAIVAARRQIGEVEGKLGEIRIPEEVLAHASLIDALPEKLGVYLNFMSDRPKRDEQKRTTEHEAKEILRSLGKPPDIEEAEKLRLTKEQSSRIQHLANEYQGLVANRKNAREEVEKLTVRLAETKRKWAASQPGADCAVLRTEVRQALKLGDPEKELRQKERAIAKTREQLDMEVDRLPYWKNGLRDLEKLSLPGEEAIQQAANAVEEKRRRLAALEQQEETEKKKLADLEGSVRALELERDVPTEDDLRAARGRRTEGWNLVRREWLDRVESAEGAAFAARIAPGRQLADAFEATVSSADDAADRLRREADRVAHKARALAQADGMLRHLDELRERLTQAGQETLAAAAGWTALLESRELPVLPLAEARKWFQDQSRIVEQATDMRRSEEQAQELREAIGKARERVGSAMPVVGQAEGPANEALASLLERAQEVVKKSEAAATASEKNREALESVESDLEIAKSRVHEAEATLGEWREAWTPLMAKLGLEANAIPATAMEYLNSIHGLEQRLKTADDFRVRIRGMDKAMAAFRETVAEAVRQIDPTLAGRAEEDVVRELQQRLARARALVQQRESLAAQLKKGQDELHAAQTSAEKEQAKLTALCKEARCELADELASVEECSRRRREVESQLRVREEEIREFSAGATIDILSAEAEQVDADALGEQLQRIDEEVDGLNRERDDVLATITGQSKDLERMDGSDAAAEAAEAADSLLTQLKMEAPRYAVLHLASAVLQRSVDRYREKNQGPVLTRASVLFGDLTVGSFVGLKIDYDESDKLVLMGVRPGGAAVGVRGMSDGSCDQLYLALRLATLEVWLESHEPIPFIVDDILLNFDDERSAAALKALAELSKKTQVFFFTHHRHLVDLAQRHLDRTEFRTHAL